MRSKYINRVSGRITYLKYNCLLVLYSTINYFLLDITVTGPGITRGRGEFDARCENLILFDRF